MHRALLTILLLCLGGLAAAQERAFVQIEAHPSLAEATQRARSYAGSVNDIKGFGLGGAWYGLALGPYDVEEARRVLSRLRGTGLIPQDSYLTAGETYGERFWPAGSGAGAAERPAAPAFPPVPDATPTPAGGPEETVPEARRTEALLTREEKMGLQRALQWFGHYDAAIDGNYGPGTRTSMAAWQRSAGFEATGVLTRRQQAQLNRDYVAAQAELGLEPLTVERAGISLTAPTAFVAFERIEAPFVHYGPKDDSGVRLSLISQAGDAAALGGLYEILQTLDIVPERGPRRKGPEDFEITGVAPDRTTQVHARLIDGHIVGYILSWPERQDALAARVVPQMEQTLASTGAPLPVDAGFEAGEQTFDMISGLEVRQPLRAASGFFVDAAGSVATAAATVEGCGRITIDRSHDATLVLLRDGIAVLEPQARLAPPEVAALAPAEGRLRSAVAVGGFPYGGVLGAATLTFGTLEDVRGLDGDEGLLRLALAARDGDVGGPVLDGGGRVAGLLLPDPAGGDRVLPDDVAVAAKSQVLGRVLEAAGIAPVTSRQTGTIAPEDLTRRAAGMTVLVGCWE